LQAGLHCGDISSEKLKRRQALSTKVFSKWGFEMRVSTKVFGRTAMLYLEGSLAAGKNIERLHETVDQLLKDSIRKFVFNMRQVPVLDCGGIGELMRCLAEVQELNGSLKLLELNPRPRQLLEWAGILTALESADCFPRGPGTAGSNRRKWKLGPLRKKLDPSEIRQVNVS
jgi:anti-anti-sigma factor